MTARILMSLAALLCSGSALADSPASTLANYPIDGAFPPPANIPAAGTFVQVKGEPNSTYLIHLYQRRLIPPGVLAQCNLAGKPVYALSERLAQLFPPGEPAGTLEECLNLVNALNPPTVPCERVKYYTRQEKLAFAVYESFDNKKGQKYKPVLKTLIAEDARQAQSAEQECLEGKIEISPGLPHDIPGGAPKATLKDAAVFAWREFIALNWPAVAQTGMPGTRGTADKNQKFGDYNSTTPLVWHTYRGKVEIFPGTGFPPGGTGTVINGVPVLKNVAPTGQPPYYGYDALPVYHYANGSIPPADGTESPSTPWINLDETSQIGLDHIFAGVGPDSSSPVRNQILFMAKANRAEFDYLAPKGWWNSGVAPFSLTAAYISANKASPPPDSGTLVSFPNGTIELKAAWRKLGPKENAERFYTAKARYYVSKNGMPHYRDDTFALAALHIIHKTPTAPYFVFATFEQADNITDEKGNPVEDPDGNFIKTGIVPQYPLTPNVVSRNATPGGFQTFQLMGNSVQSPKGQLYYVNVPDNGLPEGTITVNRRQHAIPRDIIDVNAAAHKAIQAYMKKNHGIMGSKSPWQYYKLINVQSVPLSGKIPGVDYDRPDAATFYQSNSVVETDYNLQKFSGQFFPASFPATLANTITDYSTDGKPFMNTAYDGKSYNMGGCMGCHGNAQQQGADFSFILLSGSVSQPDTVKN